MVEVQDTLRVFCKAVAEQSPEAAATVAQPHDLVCCQDSLLQRFEPPPGLQGVNVSQDCHQSPCFS